MTDQPKPEKDGTPEGYQPPSYIPAQEPDVPAPPTPPTLPATAKFEQFEQPGHGQQPYGAQGSSGEQFGWAAPGYNQPTDPYGTTSGAAAQQPYSQQPYGAPPQYGQPGSPFNAYGPPSYYGVPPESKGLSIASLCCGIAAFVGLGFFLLPQLAAVILGHLALKREPSGRGMAIAGLVLGYVGIVLTVLAIVVIALGVAVTTSGRMYYGA
jgi:hypothetical protein